MAKAKKGIWINAETGVITEVEISSLEDMQKCVGGYIERGVDLENGDEVYVNEEGLLMDPQFGFMISGRQFALSGLVIGAADKRGNNTSVKSTAVDIAKQVKFLRRQA